METIELKLNLHKIVDSIKDERLLRAVYSFLKEREKSEDGLMWESLSPEQKKEVLKAYDESEIESNLLEDDDVWRNLK